MKLSRVDERRWRDVDASLKTVTLDGTSVLEGLACTVQDLLGSEKAWAYRLRRIPEGFALADHDAVAMPPNGAAMFDAIVRANQKSWGGFDAARPEKDQRNRVLDWKQLRSVLHGRQPVMLTKGYAKFDIGSLEQLRVLVCEGASFLVWVGAWQADSFSPRQHELMRRIVPALSTRFGFERRMEDAALHSAALGAALGAIPAPAFLVGGVRDVVMANAAGEKWLEIEGRAGPAQLREAAKSPSRGAFDVTPIKVAGASRHALLVLRNSGRAQSRVLDIAARWALTPRQTRVLAELATGAANKTIAVRLGIAEVTVELHVTAILAKAGAYSRSEVIAKLWAVS